MPKPVQCDLCLIANRWRSVTRAELTLDGVTYPVELCSRHLAVVHTLFAPVIEPGSPAGAWRAKPAVKKAAVKKAAAAKAAARKAPVAKTTTAKKVVAPAKKTTVKKPVAKKPVAKKAPVQRASTARTRTAR